MAAELSTILKQLEIPCVIREDKEKGKSMVAVKGIQGSTVLFEEVPIVSWSFSTRPSGTYCDWCLTSLSPDDKKEYRCPFAKSKSSDDDGDNDEENSSSSCIAVYCSEDCQARAANTHRFLCGDALSALRNFDLHQLLSGVDDDDDAENNNIPSDGLPITLEALAKAVSTVAHRYIAYAQRYPAGTTSSELFPLAAQLFNRLVSAPGDAEFDEINSEAWFNKLRELLADKMMGIFVSVLGKEDEKRHKEIVDALLSDETLNVMLGQLTLNSQALNLPVQQRREREDDDADENDDDDDEEEDGTNDNKVEDKKESKTDVPPSSAPNKTNDKKKKKDKIIRPSVGAGVFSLHSTLNHSCEPNAFVVFTNNHEIAVKLKKTVKPGEEITITYIAELFLKLENFEQRRERLSNYFFKCSCTRCVREEREAKDGKISRKDGRNQANIIVVDGKMTNKNSGKKVKNDGSDSDQSGASEETL